MTETELREAFKQRDAELVTTYRYGPYKIVALFLIGKHEYWEVASQASREEPWTQAALDAWLRQDLVKQLDVWLRSRARS